LIYIPRYKPIRARSWRINLQLINENECPHVPTTEFPHHNHNTTWDVHHRLAKCPVPNYPPSLLQISTPTTLPTRFKSYLGTNLPNTNSNHPSSKPHHQRPYIPVFTMADPTTSTPSHFVTNTETLEDVLKTQTIGLVHLSEFKKRCVKLAERSDRDAAEKTATDLPQLRRRLGTCELVSGS